MFKKLLSTKQRDPLNAAPDQFSRHPGLVLSLDDSGNILAVSGSLAEQIADELTSLHAISGLAAGFQSLPSLLGKVIDIQLSAINGATLYFHGTLEQQPDSWILRLIDITALTAQVNTGIQAAARQQQTGSGIDLILSAEPGQLDKPINDCMARMMQAYQLNCLAVILQDNQKWQVSYCRHHQPELAQLVNSSLDDLIERAHQTVTVELTGYSGAVYSFTVFPYHYHYRTSAYLVFSAGPGRPEHTAAVIQGCRLLTGAILARKRDLDYNLKEARHQHITAEKNIHALDYHIEKQTFALSPPLCELIAADPVCSLNNFMNKIAAAEREEFKDRLSTAVVQQSGLKQHIRLMHSDGPPRWYEINLLTNRHNSALLSGSITDIDHLVQAQVAAQAAQERITTLVAHAPAIIYLQKYEQGALISHYFSDSINSLLGWNAEQFKQTSLAEHVHPDDKTVFYQRTTTLLKYGIVSCHYRLLDTKGKYHWMLDEAKLIRDQWGQPKEVVGLYIDVTESVHANEKLNASEERYRALVEDSPAIICRYDKHLKITFANTLLLDYVNANNNSAIDLNHLLSEEQQAGFYARLAKLSPDNPIINAEICLHAPHRAPMWVVWAERGIFDEQGALLEVQAVGRDNTEVYQARLELYQSAKMAMLGELATTLAHEINQPLCVMKMSISNLKRKINTDVSDLHYIQKKLERIDEQIERSTRTIEHLRFFGRRSAPDKKLFTPQHAIDGALSLTRESLENAGIDIVLSTSPTPQLTGHQDQLEQVLINLIINAKDALTEKKESTPGFQPKIYISIFHNNQQITITVEDNGTGIAEHHLNSIFDSFFTTKPHGKGTGIGLNVSFGIIEKMQGKLTASNSQQGVLFVIELPLSKQPHNQ
ncbi:PAS domain-containing sensor histidine kinase [Oceanimonas smirnovii]|uniref:PAS domain-containing sensor histidine kinase n=1 Tax=Oceanimonas smirnovii TaxID=264574 RepID=UPI003FD46B8C